MKRLSTLVLLAVTLLLTACDSVQLRGASVSVGYGTPGLRIPVLSPKPPATRVYPNGVNLNQYGGNRVYTQGYAGPSTCYVDCWN